MGDYALEAELVSRLGTERAYQLTTTSGTTPDSAKLNEAIDSAEGEMNSFFAKAGYKTPIDVVTHADIADLLKGKCLDLASFRTFLFKGPVPEDFRELRKACMEWLKMIAEGEVTLPAETEDLEQSSADGPDPQFGYNERVASRTNMADL